MSQRLPTPGSDVGTWGYVLNGFLGVAHNADGTLQTVAGTSGGTNAVAVAGGLLASNNLSDVASASTSRTNLGLGSAATLSSSAVLQVTNNLSDVGSAATARTNLGAAADASVVHLAGSETISGTKTFSAAPIIPSISNTGTVTLPTATDTLVARGTTDTLTNKRITRRVVALTDGTTISTNSDSGDIFTVTIAGNRTLSTPTGTPTDGQQMIYRITQDATGTRTITWGAAFHFSSDIPAPTLSTTGSKTDYIGFQYNGSTTNWDCLAAVRGF